MTHITEFFGGGVPEPQKGFTFCDLFAGIGGMRLGFEGAGYSCTYSNEWDKNAQDSYEANFGERPEGDITKVDASTLPKFDVLTGGFPCQPFSVSGKHMGFNDTRGTLFFDVCRILEAKKPQAFLLENVPGLVWHDSGNTFRTVLRSLKELGYGVHHRIISAKTLVPQFRRRIFLVGFRKPNWFEFPELPARPVQFRTILENNVDPKYTISDAKWSRVQHKMSKYEKQSAFGAIMPPLDGTGQALLSSRRDIHLVRQEGANPRLMTVLEAKRFMGFPDSHVLLGSEHHAFARLGNAVVPPLIRLIATEISRWLVR